MNRTALALLSISLISAALWTGSQSAPYQSPADQYSSASSNTSPAGQPPAAIVSEKSAPASAAPDAWRPALAITPPETYEGQIVAEEFLADPRASFHPHGHSVCASGCAVSNHPTQALTRTRFEALLAEYSTAPLGKTNLSLDTLLYFGRQTRQRLALCHDSPLDAPRQALLDRELARNHATVEVRLIDERGRRRAWLPPTSVPLDRRHEFVLEVDDLQPLIASGTVKRTGLDYLWTRL